MIQYIAVSSSGPLPEISAARPFKAVVIVEDAVTPEHRAKVSRWLVESGCLYMMAWGAECRAWADSVDQANREAFDCDEIPDDRVVITTWHAEESPQETFWFSKHTAMHPCFPLDDVVLVHLAPIGRQREVMDEYLAA